VSGFSPPGQGPNKSMTRDRRRAPSPIERPRLSSSSRQGAGAKAQAGASATVAGSSLQEKCPIPDRESVIVAPEGPGRAADEAHRRAIRRLFAAGLLWVGWRRVYVETRTQTKARWEHMAGRWWQTGGQPIRREYRKRAVWRSPLGQALVERLRSQLEAGARIRWSAHRAALVSACRRSTDELLSMFQTEVQQDAERLEALVRTAAAIGARDTCHLEQHRRVCQVLKALREA